MIKASTVNYCCVTSSTGSYTSNQKTVSEVLLADHRGAVFIHGQINVSSTVCQPMTKTQAWLINRKRLFSSYFGYWKTVNSTSFAKRRKSPNRIWPHLPPSFSSCMRFTAGNNPSFFQFFDCCSCILTALRCHQKSSACIQWLKKCRDALGRSIKPSHSHKSHKKQSTQQQQNTL